MTILPHISELFTGTVWRIEIDELTGTLFVEIRDSGEKKVSFASIDLLSGKTWFKDLVMPERWLTGIEAAYGGVLLLHNYQSEKSPAHKGIIAIDARSAKTLWANYNYALDHLSPDGPVLYDSLIQPRRLFYVDVKTGGTVGNYIPSVNTRLQNNIVVPGLISAETLASKLKNIRRDGNMIHYLEYNNFRIVSLHAPSENGLQQVLYVMNGAHPDGYRLVYEDLLNENIQKIQPEAFIMHNNRLIYIKNKAEIKVLSL